MHEEKDMISLAQTLRKTDNINPFDLANLWGYHVIFKEDSEQIYNKSIHVDVCEVNDELLKILNSNPDYLYQLSSRKFEEVIAEIFVKKGYDITLTPVTHDGGKDIYVVQKDDLGSFLFLVECKKYAPNHHVGLDVIQRLYGVVSDEMATGGIVVTTSYFTKSAKDFQQKHSFQMSLKDFDSIRKWLNDIT